MYVGEPLGFCGQRRVCVMCLQDRVCVLLITHPVTNLLLEPVASHSAVVLINRLGHCAQAEPCSLVCLCVHMPVCDVVCVCFMSFCCVYMHSTLKPHWNRFYYHILVFFPNKTSKYYGMLGKHPGPINCSILVPLSLILPSKAHYGACYCARSS